MLTRIPSLPNSLDKLFTNPTTAARTELKTRVRQASEAKSSGADDATEKVRLAQKRLGQAGSKGTVHKRQAARRTSRLMKNAAKDESAS